MAEERIADSIASQPHILKLSCHNIDAFPHPSSCIADEKSSTAKGLIQKEVIAMYRRVWAFISILVILATLAAQCAPAAAPSPTAAAAEKPAAAGKGYKLAVIFPGVITDADYNTLGYVAMTTAKSDLGVDTAYSESVAVPDVERVMREYVDGGYNIIWTHGSQFISQSINIAKQFKDVTIIAETDAPVEDAPENLWVIDRNFHMGFYALGALAAQQTKTGKVGYLGGLTLPFSYAEVHAVQQAIKDSGKQVELKPVWAGDFNDPTKARSVADAMIADDCDVIIGSLNLGMFGLFEAVKASSKPVLVTAKYTDKTSYAPKNYITSLLYDFNGPLKEIVKQVMDGKKGGYYLLGFDTGVAIQFPLKNTTTEINTQVEKVVNDIKSGAIKVTKDSTPIK